MKNTTALCVIILISLNSFVQLAYLGGGYRWNWSPLNGENAFIDAYNASRPWLDTQMEELNSVNGFGFSGGFGAANIWLGFDYFGRKQATLANGLAPATNTLMERELLVRNNVTNINLGFAAGDENAGITFGLQTSIVTQKVKTRVYEIGEDKGEWLEPAGNSLNLSMGPALNLLIASEAAPIGLNFHVAYTWGLFATNWGQLDEEINGTNYYYEDYPETFDSRPNYFSIGVGIWFFFAE